MTSKKIKRKKTIHEKMADEIMENYSIESIIIVIKRLTGIIIKGNKGIL